MSLISFSKTPKGRYFSLCLTIFTIFSLTNVLRWLPVIGMQMPIIIICFILLLMSCRNSQYLGRVLILTAFLLFFDYFFMYTQEETRFVGASLQNIIGYNYTVFVSFFPMLIAASGNIEIIDKRKYLSFIYILCLITAITTILGTYAYEQPCRELATPDNSNLDRLYKSLNIGGYGFIYFLVLLIPILIRDIIQEKNIFKIALLVLFGFCVIRSEYTTALLLFIVSLGVVFLFNSKGFIQKTVIVALIVALAVNLQDLLINLSTVLGEDSFAIGSRLDSLADYSDTGDVSGDMESRQLYYFMSINVFLSNPFFGKLFSNRIIGGHSEILDYIGGSGLLGLFFLFLLIQYLRKYTSLSKIRARDPYVKSTMVLVIILALFNTFLTPELFLAFLIIPLLIDNNSEDLKHIKYENIRTNRTKIIKR